MDSKVWLFDLDDTLIQTNHEGDRPLLYYGFSQWIENEKMCELFNSISNELKYIITARSQVLIPVIAAKFNIPKERIICRDFWDSPLWIKFVTKIPYLMKLFHTKSVKFKIRWLKLFVQQSEVVFYDDMAARYDIFKGKIDVRLPFF